jgi:hypothetical protein
VLYISTELRRTFAINRLYDPTTVSQLDIIEFMNNRLSCCLVSVLIFGFGGCSRHPHNAAPASGPLTSVTDPPTAVFKHYDAASLAEVPNVANLPEGVKSFLSNDAMNLPGDGPGGRCCIFIAGGASSTSAIVAFEIFASSPVYRATAFVHTDSGWVEAAHWNIDAVSSFVALKEMTARPPDY